MRRWAPISLAAAVLGITSPQAVAQRDSGSVVLARIRDEGLNRSHVMELALGLSDLNGPRLSGSAGANRGGGVRWVIGRSAVKATPWKTAGRTPLLQLAGPICGTPRGSGRATNAGRSRFSVPRA